MYEPLANERVRRGDDRCHHGAAVFDLSMAEYWQMYFAYMLLNEAQMKGAGSAIKNIPPFEYLKAVLVPVPPLSEQTRLVERYNLLLSLIAKYESEADKLNCLNLNIYDKLKKSVLQEAIQGKLVPQIADRTLEPDVPCQTYCFVYTGCLDPNRHLP